MSALWGLLGTADQRHPWEEFLHAKSIRTVALDRAPLHSLQEVAIALIVDSDFHSPILQKIWLFEGHMDIKAPILTNLVASSAARIAPLCKHPERILGFTCSPPLGNYGFELAKTELTTDAADALAVEYLTTMGLPIERIGDRAGGVFPRTIAALVNESCYALQEGLASAPELDLAMKFGVNYPRGLLEWGDLIGADYLLDVLEGLHLETEDMRYRPAPYLRRRADLKLPLKG